MAKAATGSSKPKSPSKSDILNNIAEATGQVPGVFQLPGIAKIYIHTRKAQPAKKNVLNRFTGQMQDVPAKPAKKVVKIKALKQLKDVLA